METFQNIFNTAAFQNFDLLSSLRSSVNSLQTAGLMDVVDVLIVAYIIYRVMKLLKDTSAARLVKGIIVLLPVSYTHLDVYKRQVTWGWLLCFGVVSSIACPRRRRNPAAEGPRSLLQIVNAFSNGKQYNGSILSESRGEQCPKRY